MQTNKNKKNIQLELYPHDLCHLQRSIILHHHRECEEKKIHILLIEILDKMVTQFKIGCVFFYSPKTFLFTLFTMPQAFYKSHHVCQSRQFDEIWNEFFHVFIEPFWFEYMRKCWACLLKLRIEFAYTYTKKWMTTGCLFTHVQKSKDNEFRWGASSRVKQEENKNGFLSLVISLLFNVDSTFPSIFLSPQNTS